MYKDLVESKSQEEFISIVENSFTILEVGQKLGFKHSPGKNSKEKIKNRMRTLGVELKCKESKPSKREREIDQNFNETNYKAVGDVGEAHFIYNCAKNNITISKVIGDNAPYEFVMDINRKLFKVQVKTTKIFDGTSKFSTGKPFLEKGKFRKVNYDKNDVDYFYLFNTVLEIGYLLSFDDTNNKQTTIRKDDTLNGQKENIKFHDDYIFEKVIKDLLK